MSEPQIFVIKMISQILITLIPDYCLYNQNQRNLSNQCESAVQTIFIW
jgi:hypothetical protein